MSNHACYLVTGATGFVGRQLCRRLLDDGHSVVGAVRSAIEFPEFLGRSFTTVHVGDIDGSTNWDEALNGVDVVFHLAADGGAVGCSTGEQLERLRKTNVAGTYTLARAAVSHKVKRFIYLSTIKVNGEQTPAGSCFSETSIPAPVTPYGISKWEAEQEVWRAIAGSETEGVVLRPPLVYGAGAKGNFLQLLSLAARGMPMPFAAIKNRRDLIYIDNLLEAMVLCAEHPLAAGSTYLLCDGENVSTGDLFRILAAELGVPSRLFNCPVGLMRWAAKLIGKTDRVDRVLGSLVVDGRKIIEELNLALPYSLQQGVAATAVWYKTDYLANKRLRTCQLIKRALDVLISIGLLCMLLPIHALVAVLIFLLEGRPVCYISKRFVSKDEAVSIPKFRTMVRDACSDKYRLNERFMRQGYLDIPLSCEVYTPIGRILERTQLVETLQLLTILSGKMSFIGNRPLPKQNIQLLQQFDGWDERFDSPAGISGISQVVGKYGLLPEERLELERLYSKVYQEGNVIWCDIMVVLHTFRMLLTGRTLTVENARILLRSCLKNGYLPELSMENKKS